jgi:RNA polymerase sigma factor (sigma-70 family)
LITQLIIQGCLNNDRRCQRILYEECYPLMIKISKRYCTNEEDAVDTLNTSFIKILKGLAELRNIETIYGWVKQITVRTSIDNFRAKKIYNERNTFNLDNEFSNASNTYASDLFSDSKLAVNEIFVLINELPNTSKEVLNLVTIDGYSHRETAEMLGISEENSRWHLNKARKILSEKIKNLNKYTSYNSEIIDLNNMENGK